jgi:prepilin-type N-terminal cleavage/methylation domain-containing protein
VRNRRLHSSFSLHPSAFTLIELLVVVGIIALLASILFPVIGKVRESAREADTKALIGSIDAACQTYHQEFSAYPGPLPNAYITAQDQVNFGIAPPNWRNSDTGLGLAAIGSAAANPNGFNDAQVSVTGVVADGQRVTAAENLVLGLLGGVSVNKATANNYFLEFDPAAVGQGAASLNPVRAGRAGTFMQNASLSSGFFEDPDLRRDENTTGSGTTYTQAGMTPPKDSMIPEFVDRFAQPMPILVLRSRTGGRARSQTLPAAYSDKNNDVVVNLPSTDVDAVNGQYNLVDITPYTQSQIGRPHSLKQSAYVPTYDKTKPHGLTGVDVTIGMNKNVSGETVNYPYNAFAYLADPSSYDTTKTVASEKGKMKARKQDQIILISAGRDRVYGTDDDVTNFGSVKP